MATVTKDLLSSYIFLVETPPETYTTRMCASEVNYLSEKFPKVFNTVRATQFLCPTLELDILSSQTFNIYNKNVVKSIAGNFNTFIIDSGAILSAYNTYNAEISSLSSLATFQVSALSAAVFNVFYESGSAYLPYNSFNATASVTLVITGTKIIPPGITIGAQDITYTLIHNDSIQDDMDETPGSTTRITSAYPMVHLGDFDFALDDLSGGELDDYNNNYVIDSKLNMTFYVQSNPLVTPLVARSKIFWHAIKIWNNSSVT
jgi:hypothetical protein